MGQRSLKAQTHKGEGLDGHPFHGRGGGDYEMIGYYLCRCWTKQNIAILSPVSCIFPRPSASACFIWGR